LRVEVFDNLDRADQVTISGDEQGDVHVVLKGIGMHFDGDVDIGHFFVVCHVGVAAIVASYLLGKEVAVVDVKIIQGLKGFQVGYLAAVAIYGVFDDGGKVFGGNEGLVWFEQDLSRFLYVEPICLLSIL